MNGEFVIAMHAMVYLRHKGGWLTSEEIADNACTNPVCVRRVMAKLVKAGLADKREGNKSGGYSFPAGKVVDLAAVADAVGVSFAEIKYRSGDESKPCMIASGMAAYTDGLCAGLDELCRLRLKNITLEDVESELTRIKSQK